jgi:hypothetical protein
MAAMASNDNIARTGPDRKFLSHTVRKIPRALLVVSVLLGVLLVGCGGGNGGSDQPAVCDSVDSLKTSVDNVKDTDVRSSGAFRDLESGLTGIRSELTDVKSDAKSEFSSQIDAAEKSYGALKTSVEDAKANMSAATLAAAGSALSVFRTDVGTLTQDIDSTC